MQLRVLVAGGAGYLGSLLCEHLLDAGFQVTLIDNLMYGQRCSLPSLRQSGL